MSIQNHIRGLTIEKGNKVCVLREVLPHPPTDSIKQQPFVTNSTGKTLDIIKPENSPKKSVIDWASLRENKAKYEAMKWAG